MSDFRQSYRTRLSPRTAAEEVLNLWSMSQACLYPEHSGLEWMKGVKNLSCSSAYVNSTVTPSVLARVSTDLQWFNKNYKCEQKCHFPWVLFPYHYHHLGLRTRQVNGQLFLFFPSLWCHWPQEAKLCRMRPPSHCLCDVKLPAVPTICNGKVQWPKRGCGA